MENKKSPTGQGQAEAQVTGQDKDSKFRRQLQIVANEFERLPGTMLEVSFRTGILRANICWYVATMRKQDRIFLIGKGLCSITKHRAGFYTTDLQLYNQTREAGHE